MPQGDQGIGTRMSSQDETEVHGESADFVVEIDETEVGDEEDTDKAELAAKGESEVTQEQEDAERQKELEQEKSKIGFATFVFIGMAFTGIGICIAFYWMGTQAGTEYASIEMMAHAAGPSGDELLLDVTHALKYYGKVTV